MATIKTSNDYLNPYESEYVKLKGNPFFDDKRWAEFANRGELDSYIYLLNRTDKLPTFEKFNEENPVEFLTRDGQFNKMANEIAGNRTNVDEERIDNVYDETTGKYKEVKYKMSDYDYTNKSIEEYRKYEMSKIERVAEQDKKDSMNIVAKIAHGIISVPIEAAVGLTDFIDDISGLMGSTAAGFNALIDNNSETNFDNAFRKEQIGKHYELFNNIDFQKSLIDWESKYSVVRDLDGNYTTIGKVLGGVAYSLGQALPTMGISGLTAKIGSKVATAGAKAATAIYFTGLAAGNANDMFNDPSMGTVPTMQIVLNAAVKSSAEFLVMKAMSNVFGASTLDKLMFGQKTVNAAGKAGFGTALKRISKDAVKEGTEELLQEFSGYLIDRFFAISESNFGQQTQWTLQTMLDSFILGSLSSIGASAVSFATTGRIELDGDNKLSKAASWVYNNDLSSMASTYNSIINNKKLSGDQQLQAIGQMYASFRTISSVFGELGQERVDAATKMLNDIANFKPFTNDTPTKEKVKAAAEYMMSEAGTMNEKYRVSKDKAKEIVNKLTDAKITTIDSTVSLATLDTIENAKIRADAEKIFAENSSIKQIAYTTDGITVVDAYDTMYIPLAFAENFDANATLKNVAEQRIVSGILENKKLKPFVDAISKLHARLNKDSSDVKAIYSLLYNETFYQIALYSSDKQMFNLLSELNNIAKSTVPGDMLTNAIYAKSLDAIQSMLLKVAREYLIVQPKAQFHDLTFLSKEDIVYIQDKRSELDLGNKVLAGEKLTDGELAALKIKINSMPASDAIKKNILDGILSDDKLARTSSLNNLSNHYDKVFTGKYDNKTYFTIGPIGNNIANSFFQQENMTIMSVNEANLNDVNESFKEFANNEYEFKYILGTLSVVDLSYNENSYNEFRENRQAVIGGEKLNDKRRMLSLPATDTKPFIQEVLDKSISETDASYLKLNDIINDPSVLDPTLRETIMKQQGDLKPQSVYKGLREYYVNKHGTKSITVTADGDYIFVDVTAMSESLKDKTKSLRAYKGKETKLSEVIKSDFLQGRLKNTTFQVKGDVTQYDSSTNTIVIADSIKYSNAYLQFALLHEFQHAIQTQNNLSGGLNAVWLELSAATEKEKKKIVDDVKKNRPDLFITKVSQTDKGALLIAQRFIYDISNETQAMGLDADTITVDFSPAIVDRSNNGVVITAPWGAKYNLTGSSSVSSLEKRTVPNKEAESTNLKYYIKKNRPIQLGTTTQDFIVNADLKKLDKRLAKAILAGKLTKRTVLDLIRNAKRIDEYTFQQINKAYFNNSAIKTFEQLNYLVNVDAARFYALRGVLKEIDAEHLIYDQMSHAKFVRLIDTLSTSPSIKAKFDTIVKRYSTNRGAAIDIDFDTMKVAFMRDFDGSIQSAGHIAAIAKMLAINGWNKKTNLDVSADAEIDGKKGDDQAQTLLDFISDPTAENAYSEVLDNMVTGGNAEMRESILEYMLQEEYANAAENITPSQVSKILYRLKNEIDEMTPDQLEQASIKVKLAETTGLSMTNKQISDKKPISRPRVNIAANLKRLAATIKFNLSDAEFKRLPQEYKDMFDENKRLKATVYEGVKRDKLLAVEDTLRELSRDARYGVFKSTAARNDKDALAKLNKKYTKERELRLKSESKRPATIINIGDHEFAVRSDVEVPSALTDILTTSFDKFYKTDVKYLTTEGEQHLKLNLKSFFTQNAERLARLTQQDVNEIIEYYNSEVIISNESSLKKYTAFKLYLLGFITEQSRNGTYQLSAEQAATVTDLIKATVSTAGTDLAVFKSILPMLNPNKIIIQSLTKSMGIEISESDMDILEAAVMSKDIARIDKATAKIEEHIVAAHKGKKKTVTKKLWQFQRMMMLSNPGTWVRNIASNVMVSVGNRAGEVVGKATFGLLSKITKFKRKEGQYQLIGTKVTHRQVEFIESNLIKNGLLNRVEDGINKYDVRKDVGAKHHMGADNTIVELIARATVSRFIQNNQYDTKVLDKVSKFVFSMLSDSKWINKKALSYYGKMLVEDNLDLGKGMSYEAMNMFAEAYSLAAFDYMHRTNVFNKMESAIQNWGGDNFMFVYKQLFPFASASWNWFKEGLNYTPFGLAKAIVDMARFETKVAKMESARQAGDLQTPSARFAEYLVKRDLGKGVIGSIAVGIGILLGASGLAGIDDEDDKLKLTLAGGKVKIDISNLFGTAGIFLGIALTNPKAGSFMDGFNYVADTLLDGSILSDMYNMFRYDQSIGEWAVNKPSDMLSTFIPNALKAFTRLTYNHKVKYSPGILGGFERFLTSSVPFAAYALPKQVDPYTGEIQSKYSVPFILELINSMSPIKIYTYSVSDAEQEAIAQGVKKQALTGKYEDIGPLSNKQVETLNLKYGELNKSELAILYNDSKRYRVMDEKSGKYVELQYSAMTTAQKKRTIERIMSDNAQIAKIFTWTSEGGKYYANNELWLRLKQLGIDSYKETDKIKGFM